MNRIQKFAELRNNLKEINELDKMSKNLIKESIKSEISYIKCCIEYNISDNDDIYNSLDTIIEKLGDL